MENPLYFSSNAIEFSVPTSLPVIFECVQKYSKETGAEEGSINFDISEWLCFDDVQADTACLNNQEEPKRKPLSNPPETPLVKKTKVNGKRKRKKVATFCEDLSEDSDDAVLEDSKSKQKKDLNEEIEEFEPAFELGETKDDDYRVQSVKRKGGSKIWKSKDDSIILRMSKKYQEDKIPWKKIALRLKGRSVTQCYQRYHRVISPNIDHSSFTPEELMVLESHYKSGSKSWATMAKQLKGRTDIQCKFHLERLLKSATKPWKEEEIAFILERMTCYKESDLKSPNFWITLSENVNNVPCNRYPKIRRTSLDCKRKWEELSAQK